jgi:hypothetical protein
MIPVPVLPQCLLHSALTKTDGAAGKNSLPIDGVLRATYFGSNSLLNFFDLMKSRSSLGVAFWMTILAFFPSAAAGEQLVAHPPISTQVAMHPAGQVIVQVGWSSIVHVAA